MSNWFFVALIIYLTGIPFVLTVIEYIGGFSRFGTFAFVAAWPLMGLIGIVFGSFWGKDK